MTDRTPEELAAIAGAGQARAELAQTEEAFAKVRAGMLEVIAKSDLGESVLREKLYMGVQMLDAVKKMLLDTAAGGDVAEYNATIRQAFGERSPIV